MAGRYSLQIGEQGTQAHYGNMPDVANPMPEAFAGTAKAVTGVALAFQRKKEELDMLRVEEASNELTKRLLDYTNNPETGIFHAPQYQLGGAEGLTGKFEADGKQIVDSIAETLTPAQRRAFENIAARQALPFYKSTQNYESNQILAFKKAQFDTGNDLDMQMVLGNPLDPTAMRAALDNADARIEFQYQGAPEETVGQIKKERHSELEAAAIFMVAQDDPVAAQGMIKGSKLLLPGTKAKLNEQNKSDVLKYKARGYADEAMGRFGGEYDSAGGVEWIREHVKDPDLADASVSRYIRLMGEKNMAYTLADRQRTEEQNKLYDSAVMAYAQGNPLADEQIDQLYEQEKLTGSQAAQLYSKNGKLASYGEASQKLAKSIPGWQNMSAEEQDRYYLDDAGTTPADNEAAMRALTAGLGTYVTEDMIKGYSAQRSITRAQATALTNSLNGYDKANGAAIKGIREVLKSTVDPRSTTSLLYGKYPDARYESNLADFEGQVAQLMADKDPALVQKAGAIAQGIQNKMIAEALGDPVNRLSLSERVPNFFLPEFLEGTRDTQFAKDVELAKGALLDTIAQGASIKPKPVSTESYKAIPKGSVEGVSKDILGSPYALSDGFNSTRDGGKRIHGGYDFAAPKGTPVKTPSIGGHDYTVAAVGTGKTAGNYVRLSTKDSFGNNVEWQFNHLGSTAVKAGDTASAGLVLGTVGNTGSVTSSSGGDGTHLDVKLKVNGKYMPIDKYYAQTEARQASNSQPREPPAPPASEEAPIAAPLADLTDDEIAALSDDERADYIIRNSGVL